MKLSKCALPLIVAALSSVTAEAASTATVTHAQWDLYRSDTNARLSSYSSEDACVNGAKAINVTRNYTCRTRTVVAVTATASTTCPSRPADETRSQSCPSGTTGTWQQSRTYASAAYPTCWTAGSWTPTSAPSGFCATDPTSPPPPPPPPPTGATFTDLASAPSCAKVTIYPAKTVVAASAAGIPIHTGRCLEATPSTFTQSFWATVQPGDVVTLRAGTYTTKWGEGTWSYVMGETYKRGTAAQPIAVVAAPGEVVTMSSSTRTPLQFGDGQRASGHAEYLTFGGINLIGSSGCVTGGGDTTDSSGGPSETGGKFIRIVGGSCTITDASSNTMTGLIEFSSDGWKVLGVRFRDPANRTVINNNHAVYVNNGADDAEVAYNDFQVHTGHVIQVHQDGTPKLYERISIHDNDLHGVGYGDMRGVTVSNVDSASTVSIVRNTFRHLGQSGWGCINLYRGVFTVNSNDCQDTQGGLNLNAGYGGTRKVTATDNMICPVSGYSRVSFDGGSSASQLTETSPRACP